MKKAQITKCSLLRQLGLCNPEGGVQCPGHAEPVRDYPDPFSEVFFLRIAWRYWPTTSLVHGNAPFRLPGVTNPERAQHVKAPRVNADKSHRGNKNHPQPTWLTANGLRLYICCVWSTACPTKCNYAYIHIFTLNDNQLGHLIKKL